MIVPFKSVVKVAKRPEPVVSHFLDSGQLKGFTGSCDAVQVMMVFDDVSRTEYIISVRYNYGSRTGIPMFHTSGFHGRSVLILHRP